MLQIYSLFTDEMETEVFNQEMCEGVNSGNAVSTDGKYSRIGVYFLSTILHIFNLLCLSAEPGFVLKVFSYIVHSFTTDAAQMFILFCFH